MRKTNADESNPDIRKIKTVQFIDIIKKVGLINQTPTKESINRRFDE
jgi:hypothetical protein